ncbi:MAG: metallophosphoesterase [Candidatus Aenigmarchaeota archaeon]|nr:metallophosphoesterase [Candidatus Aenigmarchaeota archaeon]
MDLKSLKKEIRELKRDSFLEIIEENLKIKQPNLVEIESEECVVVGDIHGDLKTLLKILKKTNFLKSKKTIVFLGDYGDRGDEQVEVYYVLLKLRKEFPDRVFLLRGNHEYIEGLEVMPHDLPFSLFEFFGDEYRNIYYKLKEVWNTFSYSAILNEKYFLVHGGVPIGFIERGNLENPDFKIKEQLLWNDPFEGLGFFPSERGAGFYFGKNITENFLNFLGLEKVIRSHETCNGFKKNHDGKVITVFSMKGYYRNKVAGILEINDKLKYVTI